MKGSYKIKSTRAFFSCFKPLTKRENLNPRNVWFFRAFSTHILVNFVKIIELLRCSIFQFFINNSYYMNSIQFLMEMNATSLDTALLKSFN